MIKGFSALLVFAIFIVSNRTIAQYKNTSVLAQGTWYKLGVTESGIYKIDYSLLKKIGINPDKINPKNISIYGNGGGMLPQKNSNQRIDDLAENAIYIKGGDDDKFDASDFILFYAGGPDSWKLAADSTHYSLIKNIYSDSSFYFLTISENPGKRIQTAPLISTSDYIIDTFNERISHEKENVNIAKSGRLWFGETFDSQLNYSIKFNLQGLVNGSDITINTAVAIKPGTKAITTFSYSLNNIILGSIPMQGFTSECTGCFQRAIDGFNSFKINSEKISDPDNTTITISYDKTQDRNSVGYLNYIEFNFKKKLQLFGNQTAFRSIKTKTKSNITYKIENIKSTSMVWEISDPTTAILQNGNSEFIHASNDTISEFIVFTPNEITSSPFLIGKIQNQNLHAINSVDLLIITNRSLLAEANRLAAYRRTQQIDVEVVTVDQVYNEFSSGAQDITAIRDFCRMLYKKAELKNLLLFGSCSYDYKNRIKNNSNLVPCYQSPESFNEITSLSSEDYYAFFGDNEGDWNPNDNYLMQIGIGRLPVKNLNEASKVVEKLINYNSSNALGKWRNKICYLADDGDNNLHVNDAETVSSIIDNNQKYLNINKIYIDAYPLLSTPSGNRAINANNALRNIINQGSLIINYSGHGGNFLLAQEELITIPLMSSWKNTYKLPFWVTATCDFGAYDNPDRVSGGVSLVINPDGGGIGIISATRPVYSNTNLSLNKFFYEFAFKEDSSGNMPTLGDILKNTKNKSVSGLNNRSYTLLGDPSMKLNYPKYKISITNFKKTTSGLLSDTLKALDATTIEGEIQNYDSTLIESFNGTINVDIFDKYTTLSTLNQTSDSPFRNFKLRNNVIYSGQAEVKNGKFSVPTIIPKDINYQFDKGKVSLYAYNNETLEDATGYYGNVIIGGSGTNIESDTTPPLIELYINDFTFKNGGITSNDPILLARLYDKNGINIARSAIGHEITSILNNDDNTLTVLNDYYTTDLNDYTKGTVRYQLNQLAEGSYTIKVKAWDTYNNSSESTLNFKVVNNSKIEIQGLSNYPNPFNTETKFTFNHNKAGEELDITLHIYDSFGKLVYEKQENIPNSSSIIEIPWQTEVGGSYTISPGVYVYKCTVKSGSMQTHAFQKFVLIH